MNPYKTVRYKGHKWENSPFFDAILWAVEQNHVVIGYSRQSFERETKGKVHPRYERVIFFENRISGGKVDKTTREISYSMCGKRPKETKKRIARAVISREVEIKYWNKVVVTARFL